VFLRCLVHPACDLATDEPAPATPMANARSKAPGRPTAEGSENKSWFMLVVHALIESGRPTEFAELSTLVANRLQGMRDFDVRRDVRDTLDLYDSFVEVKPGVWDFASNYSPEEVQDMRLRRCEMSDTRESRSS
jgi:hypothetical protein